MDVDVAEAAQRLGITHDAVRARIRRGSLEAVKVDGQWRVTVPDDEQDSDATATGHDTTADSLVDQLRTENEYLRDQLDKALRSAERERERADVLLLRLDSGDRTPHDAPGSPESAGNDHTRMESPVSDTTTDTTRQGGVVGWLRRLLRG